MRVILAYSSGGHAYEMMRAVGDLADPDWEITHVSTKSGLATGIGRELSEQLPGGSQALAHPERSPWRLLRNVAAAAALVIGRRPELVISTGADVTVPVFILSKVLARARTVMIETCGSLEPTLTGRLCAPFADLLLVQWPQQRDHYPKAVLVEGLLL